MGFLAIVSAIVTVAGTMLILMADSQMDAPSVQGMSPVPWTVGGIIMTAILAIAWKVG